ncbi:MAG: hypothetical protein RLO50_00380 [Azospirillaceae bacterium]
MISRNWPVLALGLALGAVLGACTETPVAVPDPIGDPIGESIGNSIEDVAPYAAAPPIALRAPEVDIRQSESVGATVLGWHCAAWPRPVRYFSVRREVARADFEDVLAEVLRDAGITATNDPTDLFHDGRTESTRTLSDTPTILDIEAWQAEGEGPDRAAPADGRRYEIGARIAALDIEFCPEVDPWTGAAAGDSGRLTMSVDWQVFDHRLDAVVLRQRHDGGATLDLPDPQHVALLAEAAFMVSARRFLADPRSRAVLTGGAPE